MKKTYKYQLPQNKEVKSTGVRVENGEILVDVEFKEKFEPRDGDFLCPREGGVFIYNGKQGYIHGEISLGAYVGVAVDNKIYEFYTDDSWEAKDNSRYATEQEKADFLERLEKELHKRWNADKKCLEDIYTPKFGDIVKVVCLDDDRFIYNHMICIWPKSLKDINKYEEACFNIANLNYSGNLSYKCANAGTLKIYSASEAEKQELFDKLKQDGKRWNEETKQLEDIRWRPEDGENYWFIDYDGGVIGKTFENTFYDRIRVAANNYFKTEEAARPYADQIKEIFKNSKAE